MVVATQNPIEQEGTYPLPEAQLDRFLFKILIGYPGRDEEVVMVRTHGHQTAMPNLDKLGLAPLCDLRFIQWVRQVVAGIRLADETVAYVVDLIRATRNHPALQFGASPRAANMLAAASRAAAVLEGREFVIPDDIKGLFKPLLRHRVVLSPSAEIDGLGTDQVLEQVLGQVAAPR
jgi:MoxR-like ATPase